MKNNLLHLSLLLPLAIVRLSAGVLTGDQVNVTHNFPAISFYDNLGTQSIPNGHYVYQSGVYTVDVFENYIEMNFSCSGCQWGDFTGYNPNPFNGPVVTRLSSAAFTGVTIDGTTSYLGFNASRLSFTPSQIFVDLKGLSINGFIRLNLEGETYVAPAATPEPATMSLAGAALGAVALLARRRRLTARAAR